jgi:hypothetical protein
MNITLRAGEYLWNPQGHHVCDDQGYAVVCTEDTVVDFDSDEIGTTAIAIIKDNRSIRGLDPDTGLEPDIPLAAEMESEPIKEDVK